MDFIFVNSVLATSNSHSLGNTAKPNCLLYDSTARKSERGKKVWIFAHIAPTEEST